MPQRSDLKFKIARENLAKWNSKWNSKWISKWHSKWNSKWNREHVFRL